MTRSPATLAKGDRGVIIRATGRIDALFFEPGPIDDVSMALLGAAYKIATDIDFRIQQVDAFRLYHADIEGEA